MDVYKPLRNEECKYAGNVLKMKHRASKHDDNFKTNIHSLILDTLVHTSIPWRQTSKIESFKS